MIRLLFVKFYCFSQEPSCDKGILRNTSWNTPWRTISFDGAGIGQGIQESKRYAQLTSANSNFCSSAIVLAIRHCWFHLTLNKRERVEQCTSISTRLYLYKHMHADALILM